MKTPLPLDWHQVQAQEQAALRPEGGGAPLAALCLSGGGIRSATMGWGVLQELAAQGLLEAFDYLSSVSGGGYIGSWLTAWKQRAGGLEAILPALTPEARPPAADLDPVGHLRAYNRYLAPRGGGFGVDTWTLAAIAMRNVLLNWLVFIPLLLLVLLLPRGAFTLLRLGSASQAAALLVAALVLLAVGGAAILRFLPSVGGENASRRQFLFWVLLPLSLAVVLGSGWVAQGWPVLAVHWGAYVTLAPPALMAGLGLAGALLVGLSSQALHTLDREWMARAGAECLLAAVVWLGACALVLLAPQGLAWAGRAALAAAVGVGGLSGWLSAAEGFRSAATTLESEAGWGWLPGAAAVFLALVGVGLVVLTDGLLGQGGQHHAAVLLATSWQAELMLAIVLFAFAWVLARFININKFSLAGMYRDRLIRAYLGASIRAAVNRFTGFGTRDDLPLCALDPRLRPFPVLNLTLNLVSGERLAWQQRMAESFTASPLACGSAGVGYRPAAAYGGKGGMTLGTAMAISGAAVSPNMGYHSSPLVGFVMTLLNARLGAWLGNPGPAGVKTWTSSGPRSAFGWLAREALGRTSNRSRYVYLSDGGHFENLGLYEMIRRRCQTILVVDASCDPDFTFEDLGNALRKIRIDFRVPITFAAGQEVEQMRRRKQRAVVATIQYSVFGEGSSDGVLIYCKPMLVGDEVPDVASYAAAHPSFPHQSTVDQWFDESQTESYRMLGIATAAAAAPHLRAALTAPRAAGA
ncbi:MAG: patatin-like phospholipase family protein [Terriglobales bacterium]